MRKRLLGLVLLLMILSFSFANAAYELNSIPGTTAGSAVTGYTITTNYYSQLTPATEKTATSSISDIIVEAIYGFDVEWETTTVNGIEPNQTATYSYTIKNVSNTPNNLTFDVITSNGSIVAGDFIVGASSSQVFGTDATRNFIVTVNAQSTATPDAVATVNVTFQVNGFTASPEYYTGFNGNVYGGYVSTAQLTKTWIKLAVINIAKTHIISHSWDGGTTVVPGAKVTFYISYSNVGSATANNIEFTDIIPTANTDYKISSTGNVCTDVGVVATFSYEATDNIGVWTYSPAETYVGSDVDAKVNRLKVGLSPLAPGESGTVNYSVIIQ